MKFSRHLLIGVAILCLSGCGVTVNESLKVQSEAKNPVGANRTVVVLPFADYSYADNLETAYRRNLFVSENLTDQLTRNSFHMPVGEDVFLYLVDQNIINVVSYQRKRASTLERELQNDWSPAMKGHLQRYINQVHRATPNTAVADSPGTHGLTQQEIVKIGRHFSADYIVRGRIIQYKDRQDPSWAPWKKGVIGFVTGVSNRVAFGQARSDKYDEWGHMLAGGTYGALYGDWDPKWPYSGRADQTIFGVSGGTMGNTIVWGAIGAGLGNMAYNTGSIPQAVVQLRIWVQDAYTGAVVWTNRVDVKVSPESVLADYQYDALFENATEKAIATLIDDFTRTL
ncbi:hypothetical protein [Desulfobulbus alkaliphilus]|uniref:hypothetical protein n=1 Tax=Desulfobulbus alkaliphilus TaxID=869814 RepID=UPI0019656104|nr:hypothetical protein [Desulfobulbus alkaliphilus]MBM9536604.1 hypothetical protein [Desulfobulbus alkaliphilus]